MENLRIKTHDSFLINLSIGSQVIKHSLGCLLACKVGAEFHAWVQIKEDLVVAEDSVPRNQNCWLVYVRLTLDL